MCFQVPDFLNAKINGLPVKEVIKDNKWLEEEFTHKVQTVSELDIDAKIDMQLSAGPGLMYGFSERWCAYQ